ncbi:MAG: hypothetical protein AMXMBFR7_39800 [Planctomycetota bacterium]
MAVKLRLDLAWVVVLALAGAECAAETWVTGPSHRVLRTEKAPQGRELWDAATRTIKLFAARNEFAAFQIVFPGPRQGVNLAPFKLTGPDGATLEHVALLREHHLNTPVLSQFGKNEHPKDVLWLNERCKELGAPREFPELLVPLDAKKYGAPFDCAEGKNELIWVDIFVPEDAKPGVYKAEFQAGGESFKLELNVWNFTLPSVSHFPQWAYIGPEQISWGFGQPHQKIPEMQDAFDAYFQMAHDHRLSLTEGFGYDEAYIKGANRKFYDHYTGKAFKGPFAPGFGFELVPVEEQFFELVKKEGWLNRAFVYLMDEPGSKEQYDEIVAKGKAIAEKTGGKLMRFVTEQFEPSKPDWPHLDQAVEVFCSGAIPPGDIPAIEAKGNVVWTYNGGHMGSAAIDAPGPIMRSHAWAGFVSGARAWYFWEAGYVVDKHNKWKGQSKNINADPAKFVTDVWNNPLNFDEAEKPYKGKKYPADWSIRINGDGLLFYPGKEAGINGPIASFRLKALRHGAQDFEYLYLLEKMGKRDDAFAEAKKLVGSESASTASSDGQSGKLKLDYDKDAAHWESARVRLGQMLHEIGDAAIRAKIQPYNQYPNPVGHPDYFGGKRY